MEDKINQKLSFNTSYNYFPYVEKNKKNIRLRPIDQDISPSSVFFVPKDYLSNDASFKSLFNTQNVQSLLKTLISFF